MFLALWFFGGMVFLTLLFVWYGKSSWQEQQQQQQQVQQVQQEQHEQQEEQQQQQSEPGSSNAIIGAVSLIKMWHDLKLTQSILKQTTLYQALNTLLKSKRMLDEI